MPPTPLNTVFSWDSGESAMRRELMNEGSASHQSTGLTCRHACCVCTPYSSITEVDHEEKTRRSACHLMPPMLQYPVSFSPSNSCGSPGKYCSKSSSREDVAASKMMTLQYRVNKKGSLTPDRIKNPCKVFVGGIGQATVEGTIRAHFGRYGEILECSIVTHKKSGKSRGFGFITYATREAATAAVAAKHKIDAVLVECREALSRDEARITAPHDSLYIPTKVFVGGIPDNVKEDEFKLFFSKFGSVEDVSLAYDKSNHRPRGFGFIVFSTIEGANAAVGRHVLHGKSVEAKHAVPRITPRTTRQQQAIIHSHTESATAPNALFSTLQYSTAGNIPASSASLVHTTSPSKDRSIFHVPCSWSPSTAADSPISDLPPLCRGTADSLQKNCEGGPTSSIARAVAQDGPLECGLQGSTLSHQVTEKQRKDARSMTMPLRRCGPIQGDRQRALSFQCPLPQKPSPREICEGLHQYLASGEFDGLDVSFSQSYYIEKEFDGNRVRTGTLVDEDILPSLASDEPLRSDSRKGTTSSSGTARERQRAATVSCIVSYGSEGGSSGLRSRAASGASASGFAGTRTMEIAGPPVMLTKNRESLESGYIVVANSDSNITYQPTNRTLTPPRSPSVSCIERGITRDVTGQMSLYGVSSDFAFIPASQRLLDSSSPSSKIKPEAQPERQARHQELLQWGASSRTGIAPMPRRVSCSASSPLSPQSSYNQCLQLSSRLQEPSTSCIPFLKAGPASQLFILNSTPTTATAPTITPGSGLFPTEPFTSTTPACCASSSLPQSLSSLHTISQQINSPLCQADPPPTVLVTRVAANGSVLRMTTSSNPLAYSSSSTTSSCCTPSYSTSPSTFLPLKHIPTAGVSVTPTAVNGSASTSCTSYDLSSCPLFSQDPLFYNSPSHRGISLWSSSPEFRPSGSIASPSDIPSMMPNPVLALVSSPSFCQIPPLSPDVPRSTAASVLRSPQQTCNATNVVVSYISSPTPMSLQPPSVGHHGPFSSHSWCQSRGDDSVRKEATLRSGTSSHPAWDYPPQGATLSLLQSASTTTPAATTPLTSSALSEDFVSSARNNSIHIQNEKPRSHHHLSTQVAAYASPSHHTASTDTICSKGPEHVASVDQHNVDLAAHEKHTAATYRMQHPMTIVLPDPGVFGYNGSPLRQDGQYNEAEAEATAYPPLSTSTLNREIGAVVVTQPCPGSRDESYPDSGRAASTLAGAGSIFAGVTCFTPPLLASPPVNVLPTSGFLPLQQSHACMIPGEASSDSMVFGCETANSLRALHEPMYSSPPQRNLCTKTSNRGVQEPDPRSRVDPYSSDECCPSSYPLRPVVIQPIISSPLAYTVSPASECSAELQPRNSYMMMFSQEVPAPMFPDVSFHYSQPQSSTPTLLRGTPSLGMASFPPL